MKVDNFNMSQTAQGGNMPSSAAKTLAGLVEGDIFKATILDIKYVDQASAGAVGGKLNEVLIRLVDGSTMSAKSLVTPDLHIGDETGFRVKANNEGQLFVEIEKQDVGGDKMGSGQLGIIKNALSAAGIPVTQHTIAATKALMDVGLPIDAQTLEKAAFVLMTEKPTETDLQGALKKALFMIKEDIPVSGANIEKLNLLSEHKMSIVKDFAKLIDEIEKLPESAEKREILLTLGGDGTPKQAKSRLFINLGDGNEIQKINEHYNELADKLDEIEKAPTSELFKEVKEQARNIRTNMEFMDSIDNYRSFIQIPFRVRNYEAEGDLYVFKNPKRRSKQTENASMLLSLDLAALGHLEAYIIKRSKMVDFQFRVNDGSVSELIKSGGGRLQSLLAEKGYSVGYVSFLQIDEPFNIVDNDPSEHNNDRPARRYAFDMRV